MCDNRFGSNPPSKKRDVGVSDSPNHNIVSALKSLLTVDECYICFRSASINHHYKTKKHVINVLSWIRRYATRFNFNLKDIISLYCEVCNDVFESAEASLFHYTSDKHNENKLKYCETCKKHVLDIIKHTLTKSHISASKQAMPLTKNSVSNDEVEKGSSIQENVVLFDGTSSVLSPVPALPKELANMVSALECKLDSLKLQLVSKNDSDCRLKSRVDKWLDGNSSLVRSDDNAFSAEVAESKPEILKANKTEHECGREPLKEKIFVELNEIIDKVYFSKIISYEDVLARLRDLNRNIADTAVVPPDEIFDEFDVLPPENVGSNNISIPDFNTVFSEFNIAENHSKQKLAMEIRRVKLVLTNYNRINVETALQYVLNLNQLLQDLASKSTDFCDIVSIFEKDCSKSVSFVKPDGSEEALQEELKKLEDSLMDDDKIKVGLALDCITQFNIQLEKLLFS